MTAGIVSLATNVPRVGLAQAETLRMAREIMGAYDDERRVEAIYTRSGIDTRGSVLFVEGDPHGRVQRFYEPASDALDRGPSTRARMRRYAIEAPALAGPAAREALARAGLRGADITHIVTASCTGLDAPGIDQALAREIACDPGVQRTHIGFMGCHAALNALRVARAIAASEAGSRVLVCCVEICTLHFQYAQRTDAVVANALFADGAAAAIVADRPGHRPIFEILATPSAMVRESDHLMRWSVGDHGFEMILGADVPVVLGRSIAPWVSASLGAIGRDVPSVHHWAIHPGGPRVLERVGTAIGLDDAHLRYSRDVLRRHGNMSSPSVLFVLDQIARIAREGDLCVAMAFGPGLSGEACILRRGAASA